MFDFFVFISNLILFSVVVLCRGRKRRTPGKRYFGWRRCGFIRPPTSRLRPRRFSWGILFECSFASNDCFSSCSYPFLWLFYFVGDGSAEPLDKGTLDGVRFPFYLFKFLFLFAFLISFPRFLRNCCNPILPRADLLPFWRSTGLGRTSAGVRCSSARSSAGWQLSRGLVGLG